MIYVSSYIPETESRSPGQGRETVVSGSVMGHCIFHSVSGPDGQIVKSVNAVHHRYTTI